MIIWYIWKYFFFLNVFFIGVDVDVGIFMLGICVICIWLVLGIGVLCDEDVDVLVIGKCMVGIVFGSRCFFFILIFIECLILYLVG